MGFKTFASVIMPVYNAGNRVCTALKSLREQDYPDLEVIIINDCSTDNSLSKIEEYVPVLEARGIHVKVISHTQNQGVAAARNTGLDHATGEFVYYVDADDRIEPDTIGLLVGKALSENADIVGCNWFLTFEKNERRMNQPSFTDPKEAIQKMLNGSMRWNLWLFMARRSLYVKHQIRFIPGMNMGEDLMVMVKLFVHATKVVFLNKSQYHYGQSNTQSLTKIYSNAHIHEVVENVKEVERCISKSGLADQLGDCIDFLKLNIKLPLLISDEVEQYQRWLIWFPEVNDRVMDNDALPLRTRFIQWLTVKRQFWAVKLYYRVVIKFVYGRLYK
ncbi:glycosyltransferase family 2 protein [Pedobacter sp. AW31-3R]|uniref:glycosyltransferase family 2 protein n=1 Tax=Pedobacter sp. AW31-3R TaxID=3445781 RepID=UPI003FA14F0C